MKDPVRVAVTGAAGQIGYALLFRIASGQMLGDDQPVILQLLEIPQAVGALEGVRMELDDCAFPLLAGVVCTDDADRAFDGADYALLVGAMPRKEGMERGDLLSANGAIFTAQGKAISDSASADVRILVVGNPANTNALIALNNAANIARRAVHRHDPARPQPGQGPARRQGRRRRSADVTKMTIWGNHSATQYPDVFHAEVAGKPAFEAVGQRPVVARGRLHPHRAAARRRHHQGPRPVVGGVGGQRRHRPRARRGRSARPRATGCRWRCRPTAATACPRAWCRASPAPAAGGEYQIVQGLDLDEFSQARIDASVAELAAERDAVAELGLI